MGAREMRERDRTSVSSGDGDVDAVREDSGGCVGGAAGGGRARGCSVVDGIGLRGLEVSAGIAGRFQLA